MTTRPLAILLATLLAGCASTQHTRSERYPVTRMVDPVTEEVPNVILP